MAIIYCAVDRSQWYQMYIEYSYTQNTTSNQSIISHALKIKQLTDGYDFNGNMTVSYSVAGDTFNFAGNVNMDDKGNAGYTITIKEGTTVVNHENDGTKTIGFSCTGNCPSGGWGPGAINLSYTNITLPTIPRASNISSASNAVLGNSCSITWTPASADHTYKLKFSLGNWSDTTDIISPNTTSAYTYTGYTLPQTIAYQLPNSPTGTMIAYLYTYSGSTQIGSTSSITFTVSVPPSVIPTISNAAASIVNENPIINEWGVAVANYTKVKITASASGSYDSTISNYTISNGYNTTQNTSELSYIGLPITSSGDKTFTVIAKDSRDRLSKPYTTNTITFYPYSDPKIVFFSAARSSENAKKVIVTANWTYSSVNENNVAAATLYYKKSSDTEWLEYGNIPKDKSTLLTIEFQEKNSYNFKIIVKDSLSISAEEEAFVSTIEVLMDWKDGGKGIGIGKVAESDNLEIAFDTIFMGDIYIQKEPGKKILLEDYIKSFLSC